MKLSLWNFGKLQASCPWLVTCFSQHVHLITMMQQLVCGDLNWFFILSVFLWFKCSENSSCWRDSFLTQAPVARRPVEPGCQETWCLFMTAFLCKGLICQWNYTINFSLSLSLSLSTWQQRKWLQRKTGPHARTEDHTLPCFLSRPEQNKHAETCTSLLGDAWPMKILCFKIGSNYQTCLRFSNPYLPINLIHLKSK